MAVLARCDKTLSTLKKTQQPYKTFIPLSWYRPFFSPITVPHAMKTACLEDWAVSWVINETFYTSFSDRKLPHHFLYSPLTSGSLNKCLIVPCIIPAAVFSEEECLCSLCFIAWNTQGFGNTKLGWTFLVKCHKIKKGVGRYKAVQQFRAKASYIICSFPSTKA